MNTNTCPKCGAVNPAAQNRSDGLIAFRCDLCKHEWQESQDGPSDQELPPIPAIDAPGG